MNTEYTTADQTFSPIDQLIPLSKALKIVGLSRSKMYLLLGSHAFPQPVKIGRNNYFSERELQAWITDKLAARKVGVRHED